MFVALRSLEGRQAGLQGYGEHGLGGELVQTEVLRPELRDQRLPAARVQQVLVGLDGGGGGEGEQSHGLLDHAAVLQLRLGTEELLGVLHGLQSLARLDELQVLLQSHLELQAGLEFPEPTSVLVTPRETLGEVPAGQAVLNLPRRQENLDITIRVNQPRLSNLIHQIFKLK